MKNIYVCTNCLDKSIMWKKSCKRCKYFGTIIKYPEKLVIFPKNQFVTAREASNIVIPKSIIPGFEFLHDVPKKFFLMIWGKPGSGKSYFSLGFAKSLASKSENSKVLYICAEEDWSSASMQEKIKALGLQEFDNIIFYYTTDKTKIKDIIQKSKPKHLILDSASALKMKWEDIEKISENIPGIFSFVVQILKSGQYRGSTAMEHYCHIAVKISKGVAKTKKNRFGLVGKMKVHFGILKNKNEF